jgi:hypothetical protein
LVCALGSLAGAASHTDAGMPGSPCMIYTYNLSYARSLELIYGYEEIQLVAAVSVRTYGGCCVRTYIALGGAVD